MKYALVTGGSRGIGRAICVQLAKDGYSVIINYKSNHAAAEETLRLIREVGGTAELLPFDVSDMDAVNAAMDKWETEHPNDFVDVLVNNAGIHEDTILALMSDEEWSSVIDTNVNGFFYITRRIVINMLNFRYGRIINMTSASGVVGQVGQVNYSAAKAAIIGATKALSKEVASRQITVNAIAPGFIETDMIDNLDVPAIVRNIPAGRLGKPQDVANMVSYLVSDKASYVTGQIIGINGGLL